jgi:transcriptional regulator with XRE-family HTH domain
MKQQTTLQRVSKTLKERRVFLELSIDDLVESTGLSWPTISRLERGILESVQLAKLELLCKKLNLTLAELFSGQQET